MRRSLRRPKSPPAVAWLAGLMLANLILGGCWDRTEIVDQVLVAGVAFDAAPGNAVRLTLQVVLPAGIPAPAGSGGGGGGQPAVAVVSASRPTIQEAAMEMEEEVAGHIFWGQVQVVLVGGAYARGGIAPVIDFMLRSQQPRLRTDVVVTRGDASRFLEVSPPYRPVPANDIFEQLRLKIQERSSAYQIGKRLLEPGRGFLVPELRIAKNSPSGTPGPMVTVPTDLKISGAGVFSAGRLVGWLDDVQVRGAMWLLGDVSRATLAVPFEGDRVTLGVDRATIQRRAVRQGQAAAILVEIDADDSVVGVAGNTTIDLAKPGVDTALGNVLAGSIRQRAEGSLDLARSMDVDIFDFGRLVSAYQPGFWQGIHAQWRGLFPKVPVILHVRAHVRNTGKLANSPFPAGG